MIERERVRVIKTAKYKNALGTLGEIDNISSNNKIGTFTTDARFEIRDRIKSEHVRVRQEIDSARMEPKRERERRKY